MNIPDEIRQRATELVAQWEAEDPIDPQKWPSQVVELLRELLT